MDDKDKQDVEDTAAAETRLRRGYRPVWVGLRGRRRALQPGQAPAGAVARAEAFDGAGGQLPAGADAGSGGQEPAGAAALAGADAGSGGQQAAAAGLDCAPLGTGFQPRRPVPVPDEYDFAMGGMQARESAVQELETGLEAAAHGPPHNGGDKGEDGDDGDGDLYTALNKSSSSIDTEEVVAFAMEWEDGDEGQEDRDNKRAPSSDPAGFQDARETARSQLAMAAFFARTGKDMLEEHKKARKQADLYMAEVT